MEAREALLKEVLKSLINLGHIHSADEGLFNTFENLLSDVSDQAIAMGLKKAESFTGFFSLPTFKDLCMINGDDLGLPSALEAYREAAQATTPVTNYKFTHPIVYHAGRLTGWFELRNFEEYKVFPMFNIEYEKLVQKILNGESIAEPEQLAIARHSEVPLSIEENKIKLKKLMDSLK